jgi:hypothetical protein
MQKTYLVNSRRCDLRPPRTLAFSCGAFTPQGFQGVLQAPLEPQYEEGFPFGPFKADFCLAGGEQVILFSWGLDSQDYPIE